MIKKSLTRLLGALSLAALALPAARAESQSDLGGYQIGDTGIFIGGYTAASYSDLRNQRATFALESLSAFVSWEAASHWSFFSEIELEDALIATPGDTTTDEAYVALERLHLDYAFSDALQLRLGKFLTPIGRWNQIHAAPLTWTTSRPLITDAIFPTNATGLMARGVMPMAGRALEWSMYGSIGEELFPEPDLDIFTEAVGLHFNQELPGNLQIGLSFADFEQRFEDGDHKTLYGADLLWTWKRAEVMAEWVLRSRSNTSYRTDERGYYIQAALPLTETLHAVGRFESLDSKPDPNFHLHLGGLAWRFRPGMVLKAEYARTIEDAQDADEGFRASFAMLF